MRYYRSSCASERQAHTDRSEAEPEVLADYVAELFGGTGSLEQTKQNSLDQLSDFLGDCVFFLAVREYEWHALTEPDTRLFVDEVAAGIEQKIWVAKPTTEKTDSGGAQSNAEATPSQPKRQTKAPPTGPKNATTSARSTAGASRFNFAPDAPSFVPRAQAAAGGPTTSLSDRASIPTGPRADRKKGSQQLHTQFSTAANGRQDKSKKRKLRDRSTSQSRHAGNDHAADNSAGERPRKQVSRGGGVGGRKAPHAAVTTPTTTVPGLSSNAAPFMPFVNPSPMAFPQYPSANGLNNYDFLTNMANMSAMWSQMFAGQAAGGQLPQVPKHFSNAKCPDYETIGVCKLGTLCPYSHGEAIVVPAIPEYDPNQSSLARPLAKGGHPSNGYDHHSFGTERRDRSRAALSQFKPSHGSDDTVVVEQIPEDRFSEQHVRDFFSQFGVIVSVQMQAYKRLAVVKFSDHAAAQRAYDSPKVIFDNRFVKVYWYKAEHAQQSSGTTGTTANQASLFPALHGNDENMIDLEETKQRQAHMQKEWEEKRRKAEEVNARYQLLDAQARAKEEAAAQLNLRIQAAERAKGVQKINQKEQLASASDLAKMQSEAARLFENAEFNPPASTGRDGFTNGRGSSFRGGYRGRGAARGRGGAVVRLDNRPRCLAIASVQAGSEKERTLKQHLLNVKGCNGVQPHPERADTLIVGFEQRYQAEIVSS